MDRMEPAYNRASVYDTVTIQNDKSTTDSKLKFESATRALERLF